MAQIHIAGPLYPINWFSGVLNRFNTYYEGDYSPGRGVFLYFLPSGDNGAIRVYLYKE